MGICLVLSHLINTQSNLCCASGLPTKLDLVISNAGRNESDILIGMHACDLGNVAAGNPFSQLWDYASGEGLSHQGKQCSLCLL